MNEYLKKNCSEKFKKGFLFITITKAILKIEELEEYGWVKKTHYHMIVEKKEDKINVKEELKKNIS